MVGFGQLHDSVLEGEDGDIITIRLTPEPISENITGQVIPLTIKGFISYMSAMGRSIPEAVQTAIMDDIIDPAECKLSIGVYSYIIIAMMPSYYVSFTSIQMNIQ